MFLVYSFLKDDKFQEFVSNIAIKKYEVVIIIIRGTSVIVLIRPFKNDSKDEWIVLKKKYMGSNPHSPPHMGFFASKLQKTKQNLTKFSNKV